MVGLIVAISGILILKGVIILRLYLRNVKLTKSLHQQQERHTLRINQLEEENKTLDMEIEFLKKIYREKLLHTFNSNPLKAVTND